MQVNLDNYLHAIMGMPHDEYPEWCIGSAMKETIDKARQQHRELLDLFEKFIEEKAKNETKET